MTQTEMQTESQQSFNHAATDGSIDSSIMLLILFLVGCIFGCIYIKDLFKKTWQCYECNVIVEEKTIFCHACADKPEKENFSS